MSNHADPARIQGKPLLISLAIPLATGSLAAFLTSGSMDVYKRLNQPPLAPPGWVFPIVWSILYTLMGIASYLVWLQGGKGRGKALAWYAVQLACNFFWTLIFFNMGLYALAFFWLAGLWVLVLLTAIRFFQQSPPAGWLLLPYLLWTAFAGYLNLGVWLLNRAGTP